MSSLLTFLITILILTTTATIGATAFYLLTRLLEQVADFIERTRTSHGR